MVVLNGTSSAGKTTIATRSEIAAAAVGDFWLLIGIDDVLSKLPAEWLDLGLPTGRGRHAADGLWFEATPAGPALRVGRLCRQLLHIYRSTVAAAAHAGLNVIVDDVVIDAQIWHDWQDALTGLDVVWVGVRCDLDVVEARSDRVATRRRHGPIAVRDRSCGGPLRPLDRHHLVPPGTGHRRAHATPDLKVASHRSGRLALCF